MIGVTTWTPESLTAVPGLDTVYVPVGLGSGICGAILMRSLLGPWTKVVGLQSTGTSAYARSFDKIWLVELDNATTYADGMATRIPYPAALAIVWAIGTRVATVADDEVAVAIRA